MGETGGAKPTHRSRHECCGPESNLALGDAVDRNRAILQLALVRAVLRSASKEGGVSEELRQRASEIVERTAIEVVPEADGELAELLAAVRAQLAQRRTAG